jgi:hypothetical protein
MYNLKKQIEVFLYNKYKEKKTKRISEKTISEICNSVSKYCELKHLTKSQQDAIQDYWYPLVGKKVGTRLHQVMLSLTGMFKPEFEPFEICHEVQARSMDYRAFLYFDDKNLYRSLLSGFNIPVRVAECSNGIYYLPEQSSLEITYKEFVKYLSNQSNCLIKPSVGTDGGRGIRSFDTKDGLEMNSKQQVMEVLSQYGKNYCVERKVIENDNLQCLNPTSCNTLRVHTIRDRKEQRIRFLSSYVRIGKMGQVVDNMLSGGLGARIHDDGCLRNAVSCYPYQTFDTTESGVKLEGYKIEYFDKIVNTCLAAHSRLPMFDLMGWDVTVDKDDNVIIIEYNPNPDIRIEQAIFGDTCLLDNQEWVMKQYFTKCK